MSREEQAASFVEAKGGVVLRRPAPWWERSPVDCAGIPA